MLAQVTDFPHAGSKAFLGGTADPVTIMRRNADGTALVRMDPRPHHPRNRDASGNRTVDLDQLHQTERAAFDAAMASSSGAVGRKKQAPKRKKGAGNEG